MGLKVYHLTCDISVEKSLGRNHHIAVLEKKPQFKYPLFETLLSHPAPLRAEQSYPPHAHLPHRLLTRGAPYSLPLQPVRQLALNTFSSSSWAKLTYNIWIEFVPYWAPNHT